MGRNVGRSIAPGAGSRARRRRARRRWCRGPGGASALNNARRARRARRRAGRPPTRSGSRYALMFHGGASDDTKERSHRAPYSPDPIADSGHGTRRWRASVWNGAPELVLLAAPHEHVEAAGGEGQVRDVQAHEFARAKRPAKPRSKIARSRASRVPRSARRSPSGTRDRRRWGQLITWRAVHMPSFHAGLRDSSPAGLRDRRPGGGGRGLIVQRASCMAETLPLHTHSGNGLVPN